MTKSDFTVFLLNWQYKFQSECKIFARDFALLLKDALNTFRNLVSQAKTCM